jgi:hypothetical protein
MIENFLKIFGEPTGSSIISEPTGNASSFFGTNSSIPFTTQGFAERQFNLRTFPKAKPGNFFSRGDTL